MGCVVSSPNDGGGSRRRPGNVGEVAVFVPGLRIPKSIDFSTLLVYRMSKCLVERLSALRTRIVVMAAQEAPAAIKPRRKTASQHGGSRLSDLTHALEDYLPVLLGLVKDGSEIVDKVQFLWANQVDDAEETIMANAWYEVLSVLHLMAMLCLSEANILLLPKEAAKNYQPKVSEENKRSSVGIFLKAAGYLDFAVQHVLPWLPPQLRKDIPLDLSEGVLTTLCQQALGQAVDIQLGMAIDSPSATLAVKRRLACEMVKCWHEAHDNITQVPFNDGWGVKYQLFVKWKYTEAQAAAYYYHGLILDEGNAKKSQSLAVAALRAAEEFLKESKRTCEEFNSAPPISRTNPLWGSVRYLTEKIPKDASIKVQINEDLYTHEKILETAPPLPDFALALKPDDYQLPPLARTWNDEDTDHHNTQ